MLQVGCASASSGPTSASSSRVRPRNGPPEAVSTSECTLSGLRSSRHWYAAECSLSTGSSRPPPRRWAAVARSPAATRLSLFARARSTPCSRAQSRRYELESWVSIDDLKRLSPDRPGGSEKGDALHCLRVYEPRAASGF